jgi:hypothetical protein
MIAGKISKAHNNIILSANLIKKTLQLSLSPAEEQVEQEFAKGRNS